MRGFICIMLLTSLSQVGAASDKGPGLPRSTPEKQGVSSAGILEFVEAADREVETMNSFMLLRHGFVVAEGWWSPYNPQSRHSMYSLSKSFTSTAVGLAIEEGKLSLTNEVLKFFPEDAPPEPSANLRVMRVHDLLRMSSGHHSNEVSKFSFDSQEKLTRLFLAMPVDHKPGTHFFYNTPGTYMLSAIVQKVTGMTVLDYLEPRLFEPLGIENPTWETRQGISFGGSGLSIRTEDIARFGQLYLQKGQWHGRQLVPVAWVEAATSRQTSNGSDPNSDWDQGYGYQFWRSRHGVYRGDGAFGQFCLVIPDQDAVVAITSGTKNMQQVMNLVWDHVLPAFKPKSLPANEPAQRKLVDRLAHLEIPPQTGTATPSATVAQSGRRFQFATNDQKVEAAALEFGITGQPATLILKCNGVDQRLDCSVGKWTHGRMTYGNLPEQPVATSGAWVADDTYAAKLCFYETPFCIRIQLKFVGGEMQYNAEYNVGSTRLPQLVSNGN